MKSRQFVIFVLIQLAVVAGPVGCASSPKTLGPSSSPPADSIEGDQCDIPCVVQVSCPPMLTFSRGSQVYKYDGQTLVEQVFQQALGRRYLPASSGTARACLAVIKVHELRVNVRGNTATCTARVLCILRDYRKTIVFKRLYEAVETSPFSPSALPRAIVASLISTARRFVTEVSSDPAVANSMCGPQGIAADHRERPSPAEPDSVVGLPSSSVQNRFAVVVGISEYQDSGDDGFRYLPYADDDAEDFARILMRQGWKESHIKLLVNEGATEKSIKIALESWLTKAGPDDLVLLFWSGHGYPDPDDPEKVYFACYETMPNVPASGYRMDRVRDALAECRAKNVVVLADTCHAGKLVTRGSRGLSILPNVEKMREDKTVPSGWVFMVAADTDRQAVEDSSWSNGAFTHCLIRGLMGEADGFEGVGPKDGVVSMGELRAYLLSEMPDTTQKALGAAKHPLITTSSADPVIWELTLSAGP